MSIEKKLVAACLRSKTAFTVVKEADMGSPDLPQAEWALEQADIYYETDTDAKEVDVEWLKARADVAFDSEKKADEYKAFIDELYAQDVSSANMAMLVLEQRKKALSSRLAVALVNNSKDVSKLLEEYGKLDSAAEAEGDVDEDVYHSVSIEDSLSTVLNPSNLIKLPTRALNEVLEGGVVPRTHIVVVARPETGKTAFCISFMRAMAFQKLPGIYFGNEDPIRQIIARTQGAFTGLTKDEIRHSPEEAQRRLDRSGFDYLRFISINPGTPDEIRKYCRMYKPRWVLVDQLRNLRMGSASRVEQLEAAATAMRNIANEFDAVVVSITQAGDSADNKLVLGMGDTDYSNTGIPAQADVMVMIGVNQEFADQGLRMFSLPKNKVSGKHLHFPVRLNGALSRYEDV